MIGMLYPPELLKRLKEGRRCFEKPAFYVEAARELGEQMLFFSLEDINWKRGTVRGWDGIHPGRRTCLLPDVIVNRTRTTRRTDMLNIRRLTAMGKIVFNKHNVLSKLAVHRVLFENESLRPHLPETAAISRSAVKQLLRRNDCLFLKPNRSSVGEGIIRLRKIRDDTFAEVNVLGITKRRKVTVRKLVGMLKSKRRGYLAQQGIALMRYNGRPVDFRVSMQKDGNGCWQCTGIVGKVARKRAIVTNLHCGGKSVKTAELFRSWGWDGADVERNIVDVSGRIARTLEARYPHIADLGLDLALDEHRHPWFIEANLRDLRVTFRHAGEREVWRSTFANPIKYAAFLLRSRQETAGSKRSEAAWNIKSMRH